MLEDAADDGFHHGSLRHGSNLGIFGPLFLRFPRECREEGAKRKLSDGAAIVAVKQRIWAVLTKCDEYCCVQLIKWKEVQSDPGLFSFPLGPLGRGSLGNLSLLAGTVRLSTAVNSNATGAHVLSNLII